MNLSFTNKFFRNLEACIAKIMFWRSDTLTYFEEIVR